MKLSALQTETTFVKNQIAAIKTLDNKNPPPKASNEAKKRLSTIQEESVQSMERELATKKVLKSKPETVETETQTVIKRPIEKLAKYVQTDSAKITPAPPKALTRNAEQTTDITSAQIDKLLAQIATLEQSLREQKAMQAQPQQQVLSTVVHE